MIGTVAVSNHVTPSRSIEHARQIIPFQPHEMAPLARTELLRFLTLVESLSGDDWTQPTDCTAWNVRAVLAHRRSSQLCCTATIGRTIGGTLLVPRTSSGCGMS